MDFIKENSDFKSEIEIYNTAEYAQKYTNYENFHKNLKETFDDLIRTKYDIIKNRAENIGLHFNLRKMNMNIINTASTKSEKLNYKIRNKNRKDHESSSLYDNKNSTFNSLELTNKISSAEPKTNENNINSDMNLFSTEKNKNYGEKNNLGDKKYITNEEIMQENKIRVHKVHENVLIIAESGRNIHDKIFDADDKLKGLVKSYEVPKEHLGNAGEELQKAIGTKRTKMYILIIILFFVAITVIVVYMLYLLKIL